MVDGHIVISILTLIAYLAISYVVGRLLVARLTTHPSPLLLTGAPLIGAGILALQLWLYGSVRLPWNRVTLLLPWLVLVLLSRRRFWAALVGDWELATQVGRALTRLEPLELVLAVTGMVFALTYLLNLVTQPVTGIDAIAMWLYKAKLYYAQNAVDLRPVAPDDVYRNLDYPPLFSLMVSTLYVLMGRVDDIFGKSVNFLFFVVGTASFLALVRSLMSRVLTVLFGFLLVAMPIFSFALFSSHYMGWADYPFGIWMLVALIYLFDGVRADDGVSLLFAMIAAAMAALTKNEGLSFLAIILLLLGYRLARKLAASRALPPIEPRLLATGLLALAPVVLWQLYIRSRGFDHAVLSHRQWGQLLAALPGRAVQIVRGTRPLATFALDYPWIAVSFVLASLLLFIRRPRISGWVYAAVAGQIAAYFIAYLLTPYDLDYILSTTLGRLFLQLAPSILLLLAITLGQPEAAVQDATVKPTNNAANVERAAR
ncbi:MAG TPA: hypothetical protein VHK65_03665 [Candidatus Dormibacteraeota bacterium]|nr:hypothetical protein [Candidatus Dormibacteraeota bacterium]